MPYLLNLLGRHISHQVWYYCTMQGFLRGMIGLGVTLGVLGAGMAVVNGLARGWAGKRLVNNPDDSWARGILMLY